jgi:hypothetical protein
MAAKTAPATQTVWDQINDLRQEASDLENEAREKIEEGNAKMAERNTKIEQMQQLLAEASGGTAPTANGPTPKNAAGPTPKHAAGPTPRKAGGPAPKHAAAAPAPKTKPTAAEKPKAKTKGGNTGRMYGQGITMPEAVWDAIDRDPATYKTILPEYPEGASGLKVSEIRDVIEKEGKRQSSAENISPMIQQIVGDLRYEGKLGRDEDTKRYWAVAGAELYGPPLNADGTAMTAQDDGTFLKSDGKVFTDKNGKPIKQRVKKGGGEQ